MTTTITNETTHNKWQSNTKDETKVNKNIFKKNVLKWSNKTNEEESKEKERKGMEKLLQKHGRKDRFSRQDKRNISRGDYHK